LLEYFADTVFIFNEHLVSPVCYNSVLPRETRSYATSSRLNVESHRGIPTRCFSRNDLRADFALCFQNSTLLKVHTKFT